jgi:aspartyl-tRNA(Asn)/glutamyl-tRNA(Gln) amidotransferase subunit C
MRRFDIGYFARLARIKLTVEEEERFSRDLVSILNHVRQLEKLNTEGVPPLTGGTDLRNVYREDLPEAERITPRGVASFPKNREGYLSVPKVFG